MRSRILITALSAFFIFFNYSNDSFAQIQQNEISFLDRSEVYELNQSQQSEYNPWTIHRKISAIGFAGSMAATLVGSLAMDDEFFATTVIPVVGPFVTIARIENDPNSDYLPGGKQLLTASGILQSAFAVYFVTSLIGESNYKGRHLSSNISVAPIPVSKGVGGSMNVRF